MSHKIAVSVFLILLLTVTCAQAEEDTISGLLGVPTPPPSTEATPTPTLPPGPTPDPTPTPEQPPEAEAVPIPQSIIFKAVRPRTAALDISTATEEEKLEALEVNLDSIIVSLTFVQKAKGYDISGVLAVITKIMENMDMLTLKQLDTLVTVSADIDNEIVMAIFGGTIVQTDIDRIAADLANAMKTVGELPDFGEVTVDNTTVLMALGFIAGILLALITVKGFDG